MAKRKGNPLKRKTGSREYRAICWVSAEGQTEKDYLQMDIFRTSDIIIRFPRNIHPGRRNPTAVLKRFHKAMRTEEFREGDEAWIIVDVDTWDETEFSQLLDWTKEDPRHHLAISNPKFELFLIMHFERGGGCTTPQIVGAVLKRHAPRCSGGGHEPAHPARCQGRHPQCRDRARPHRQPHPRAQSGRRPPGWPGD